MRRTSILCAALLLLSAEASAKKRSGRPRPAPQPSAPTAPATTTPEAAPPEENAAPVAPAPAPTPPPAPAPIASPTPAPAASSAPKVDLEGLNAEYNAIRDELFRSRAKVELLGTALYKTRVVATFQYRAQRAWPLRKVTLQLDDHPVYSADAPAAADTIRIYEGFAAPGRHTLVLRVECGAVGNERTGYGAEGTFVIDVPDGKQSRVAFSVDESGDGPAAFGKRQEGTFDVRIKADVQKLDREVK